MSPAEVEASALAWMRQSARNLQLTSLPDEHLDLMTTAGVLTAYLNRSTQLLALLQLAQAELEGHHNAFSHDYVKDERKCPKCQLRARLREVLGAPQRRT